MEEEIYRQKWKGTQDSAADNHSYVCVEQWKVLKSSGEKRKGKLLCDQV